jgi:MFS transporter, Spinster family, sphingosine-1-phosphate transporter
MPRGKAEPEFEDMAEMQTFKFSWKEAGRSSRRRPCGSSFLQGFAGVFPWNVITFFFFAYLERERGYDANSILFTMAPVILILASGYFVGGALRRPAFQAHQKGTHPRFQRGRFARARFSFICAHDTPHRSPNQFFIFMCLTAIFMPLSSANVIATVYDVTVPEVRSTAQAVEYFIENGGAGSLPLTGRSSPTPLTSRPAILLICIVAWAPCAFSSTSERSSRSTTIHNDLRTQMAERAK